MSIHNLIPEKIISKAPHALGWVMQSLIAAALPEIYEKMPRNSIWMYIGLTPENLSRLKYFTPALLATLVYYIEQLPAKFSTGALKNQNEMNCCPCS
ncbi:hypothetical protein [Mucilaginibacter sp.]|uniref:hypothetical protein n=1 Tax=Mucilaginibacter sp. TaxID=1882438 RepID=UPI003D108ACA